MNATKLAPLVLICLVALTMTSGISFALSSSVKPIPKGDPINNPKPNGDPIDDPIPNGVLIDDSIDLILNIF